MLGLSEDRTYEFEVYDKQNNNVALIIDVSLEEATQTFKDNWGLDDWEDYIIEQGEVTTNVLSNHPNPLYQSASYTEF